MLSILRYSVVSTFENATKHWKSFFLISLVFIPIATIMSALCLFLYALFEIMYTGRPSHESFFNLLSRGDGEDIMSAMYIPLTGIYVWFYLFYLKKGSGKPTVRAFFRNIPKQGWGTSFIIAFVLVLVVTVLGFLIPDMDSGLFSIFDQFGMYDREYMIVSYLGRLLRLVFMLLPFFGIIIVFSKMEFNKFRKLQFKAFVKPALAIFILGICVLSFEEAIVDILHRYVFYLFDLLDPYLGVGQIMTSLFRLFVLTLFFIFFVALMAHCIEYPFRNEKDGLMSNREYKTSVNKADTLDGDLM
jgi:hypothetical protein